MYFTLIKLVEVSTQIETQCAALRQLHTKKNT